MEKIDVPVSIARSGGTEGRALEVGFPGALFGPVSLGAHVLIFSRISEVLGSPQLEG